MNIIEEAAEVLREQFNSGATQADTEAFLKYYKEVLWPKFCEDFASVQPMHKVKE